MAVPTLFPFVKQYHRQLQRNDIKPTKVALIDNGVMMISLTRVSGSQIEHAEVSEDAKSRIRAGNSFVHEEGGKMSPWYLQSQSHGTQMANLICAIDPFCELYVAKVGDERSDISPLRVAEVSIGSY